MYKFEVNNLTPSIGNHTITTNIFLVEVIGKRNVSKSTLEEKFLHLKKEIVKVLKKCYLECFLIHKLLMSSTHYGFHAKGQPEVSEEEVL